VVDFWGWFPRPAVTTLREPHVTKMRKKRWGAAVVVAAAFSVLVEAGLWEWGKVRELLGCMCFGLCVVCVYEEGRGWHQITPREGAGVVAPPHYCHLA
jgi:hypothetical protein